MKSAISLHPPFKPQKGEAFLNLKGRRHIRHQPSEANKLSTHSTASAASSTAFSDASEVKTSEGMPSGRAFGYRVGM